MNILVIGDTHFPGHHDKYYDFIIETAVKYSIDEFIHVGDLVDFHYISRHITEPDADNAIVELDKAKEELVRWVDKFPNLKICKGNHDMIPYRQAGTLGIPKKFLKSLNELLELPDTWTWHHSIVIDDIVVEHGLGSGGKYGAFNTALKYMCNYVQGHTHSYGSVLWHEGFFKSVFGMQVGCGVDKKKYHSRYGKNIFKHGLALGCGVVLNADTPDKTPLFVRMTR